MERGEGNDALRLGFRSRNERVPSWLRDTLRIVFVTIFSCSHWYKGMMVIQGLGSNCREKC